MHRVSPKTGSLLVLPALVASAVLAGCATPRVLTRVELEPTPPRRLALAVQEPRRLVETEGVSLAIHDSDPAGTRQAIVCLHAVGQGGGDFKAFEAAFRDRFRVITVDWPGHGASGADTQPASAHRYALLLRGLLDALQLERPVLFGNSIGGAAAIALAQQAPGRVRALVLCNPGGLDPGGFLAGLFIDHLVSRFRTGARARPRSETGSPGTTPTSSSGPRQQPVARRSSRRGTRAPPASWRRGRASPCPAQISVRGYPPFPCRCSSAGPCAMGSCSGTATAKRSPPFRA